MKREEEIKAYAPPGKALGQLPRFCGSKKLDIKLNALNYSKSLSGAVSNEHARFELHLDRAETRNLGTHTGKRRSRLFVMSLGADVGRHRRGE